MLMIATAKARTAFWTRVAGIGEQFACVGSFVEQLVQSAIAGEPT